MKPLSAMSMVIMTLALPIGAAGTELPTQPAGDVRLGPRLVIDIKAKSVVGPSVRLGDANVVHVAWVEEDQNERKVRYTHTSGQGDAFAPAVSVNAPEESPYSRQEAPALDVQGQQVYLAWAKMHPQTSAEKPLANELRLSRSTDGGTSFLPSVLINDDGLAIVHSFDSLRIGHEAALHVAWIDAREGKKNPGTYVSRSDDHGKTFSKNTKIDDETCVCCRTAVAVAPDGTVYTAWRKIFGEIKETVVARSVDGGATFSAPVIVGHDRWAYPSCPHRPASLGVDRAGRLYVAWYTEGEDETPAVYVAYSDDRGHTFSQKRMLNASKGTFPDHPQLAVDSAGRVVALWEELSPVRREVVMSYSLDGGRTFSPPKKLNEKKGESPSLAANAAGQIVLAWKEHAMPAHRLVIQRLELPERQRVAHGGQEAQ
jgi:BNR repeat-like domain